MNLARKIQYFGGFVLIFGISAMFNKFLLNKEEPEPIYLRKYHHLAIEEVSSSNITQKLTMQNEIVSSNLHLMDQVLEISQPNKNFKELTSKDR